MAKTVHDRLLQLAKQHMDYLTQTLPDRCVGSESNRLALAYFEQQVIRAGFSVTHQPFTCFDWRPGETMLRAGGRAFRIYPGPYSPACDLHATLTAASSLEELEAMDIRGRILLLHGALVREPLMPKHFTFYNPESHQAMVRLLEARQPAAIIAATERSPEMAGAVYPFPFIEDGDFEIPNAFMTGEEGVRLAAHVGEAVEFQLQATRHPADGWNVAGLRGAEAGPRLVLTAHIDAKRGTPGALDNATGVTTLMLLAGLLADYEGNPAVEITVINGEDHFANPGEMAFLARNEGRFGDILLGINLDGIGYKQGRTAYSFYDVPDMQKLDIETVLSDDAAFVAGPPWYQSDHFLFIMNQRPALAFTSEQVDVMLREIVHTDMDRMDQVAPVRLVETAVALETLIRRLGQS